MQKGVRMIEEYLSIVHNPKNGVLGEDVDLQKRIIENVVKSVKADSQLDDNPTKRDSLLKHLALALSSPKNKVLLFVDSRHGYTANMAIKTNSDSTEHQTVYAHVIIPKLKWIDGTDGLARHQIKRDENRAIDDNHKLFDVTPIQNDDALKKYIIGRFRKRLALFDWLNISMMTDVMYYVYFKDIGGSWTSSISENKKGSDTLCKKVEDEYYPPYGWSDMKKCNLHTIRSTVYHGMVGHLKNLREHQKATAATTMDDSVVLKQDDPIVGMYNKMSEYFDNNTKHMIDVIKTIMTQVLDSNPADTEQSHNNIVNMISSFLTGSGVNLCRETLSSDLMRIDDQIKEVARMPGVLYTPSHCAPITDAILQDFMDKERYLLPKRVKRSPLIHLAIYNWYHQTCYVPVNESGRSYVCVPTIHIQSAYRSLIDGMEKTPDFMLGKKMYYPGLLAVCLTGAMYKIQFVEQAKEGEKSVDVTKQEVERGIRKFVTLNRPNILPDAVLTRRLDNKKLFNTGIYGRLRRIAMPTAHIIRVFGENNVTLPNKTLQGCGKYRTLHYIRISASRSQVLPAFQKTESCLKWFIHTFDTKSVFELLKTLDGRHRRCKGAVCKQTVRGGGVDVASASASDSETASDVDQMPDDSSARHPTLTRHIPIPVATLDYPDQRSKHIRGKIVRARKGAVRVLWDTKDLPKNPEWVDVTDLQFD